jgi:hypothetical protein
MIGDLFDSPFKILIVLVVVTVNIAVWWAIFRAFRAFTRR